MPELGDVRVLREVAPSLYRIEPDGEDLWRCLNAAWGCNWMVPGGAHVWCRSCRLTRGRPHGSDVVATERWARAEGAKRRLVHQLDSLGLPVAARSEDNPDALVFDLVHVPGAHRVTGHVDGVVTIDLTESDEVHRGAVRRSLGEPFRTMMGHLRHEVGHQLWPELVGSTDLLGAFRDRFGDERTDYAEALARHHDRSTRADSPDFVSWYATAHPHEDWAESFAHLLHIQDATETARAHGLALHGPDGRPDRPDAGDVAATVASWARLAAVLDELAAGLGGEPVYPFRPGPGAVEKLAFVDRAIRRRSGDAGDAPPRVHVGAGEHDRVSDAAHGDAGHR